MNKLRISKYYAGNGAARYYPEHYFNPKLFGLIQGKWKRFTEWSGCDPLGFDYGNEEVYFTNYKESKKFIKKLKNKTL